MKKQAKRIRRLVFKSIISTFIITILLLSHGDKTFIAVAQAIINQPYSINTLLNKETDHSKSAGLYELKEYRDIDKKVFVNEDGFAELSIYGDAVHYLDDGEYKDIDNTLIYDEEKKQYTNTANFYEVNFPEDLKDNYISINYFDYEISYKVKNINTSNLKALDKVKSHNTDIKTLSKVTNGIKYENILPNVDLSYELKGQSIKEDIILNKYIEEFSITFEYELINLTMEKIDGTVFFINDTSEKVSQFSDFILIDGEGKLSNEVNIELNTREKNKYEVTLSVNDELLKNTKYPLIIDPSINLSDNGLTVQTKTIYRDYSTGTHTLYPNPASLTFARLDSGRYVYESYIGLSNIQNALSSIKKIDSVFMEFNVQSTSGVSATSRVVALDILNYSYSQIGASPLPLQTDMVDLMTYTNGDSQILYDITNEVYNWIDDDTDSCVYKIQSIENQSEYVFQLYGMASSITSLRPAVRIYYSSETGLVPYQDYSTFDSSAGTLFVNNYTLAPIFAYNDYSDEKSLLSVSHIFNNSRASSANYGYGLNWNLNVNKEFSYTLYGRKYLLNADGFEKNFAILSSYNDVQTNGIASDGSEDLYTFKNNVPTSEIFGSDYGSNLYVSSPSVVYVQTPDYIRYEFRKFSYSSNYKLVKIVNIDETGSVKNDMNINIKYIKNSSGFFVQGIELNTFNNEDSTYNMTAKAEFLYTSSYLDRMNIYRKDQTGAMKLLQYNTYSYSSGKLIYILPYFNYNDDVSTSLDHVVNFSYENNGLKTASRNNEDGLEITYSLINDVSMVEQKSGTLLTNRITFDNRGKTTFITDKDGYVTKKMYDDYGRYTGTVNPLGILNKISYYDHDINSNYHNIHKIIGTSSSIESFANLIKNGEFEYSALISDNWTTASDIPNGGTYSYYQCVTGSESLCQQRVNSGKKSLYLNKYSSSSYYMLYQTVNIKQGYYSLSAYASADLGIDVDDTDSDPNDLVFQNVQPHGSKINSDENPNMGLYRVTFYSAVQQDIRVIIKLPDYLPAGSVYVDDITLIAHSGMNLTNMVVNSSFEDGVMGYSTLPTTRSVLDGGYTNDEGKIFGKNLLEIDTGPTISKLSQTIYIPSLTDKKAFSFGANIKTFYNSPSNSYAKVTLIGRDIYNNEESFTLKADNYVVNQWQYLCSSIKFSDSFQPVSLELVLEFQDAYTSTNDHSFVQIDNLFVYHRVTDTTYKYGEEGNLAGKILQVVNSEDDTTDIEYDEYGRIISYKSSIDTSIITRKEYVKDEQTNIESVCTYVKIDDGNTVNGCGNPSNIRNMKVTKDGIQYISKNSYYINNTEYSNQSINTYDKYNRLLLSSKNIYADETGYEYYSASELIKKLTEPDDGETLYEYDDFGRIVLMSKNASNTDPLQTTTIKYTYDIYGNIDLIKVNESTTKQLIYDLDFDRLGRLINTKIGSASLFSNTYVVDNGFATDLVNENNYANGTSYRFEYDDYNRLKLVQVKGTPQGLFVDRYKYDYDYRGLLTKYTEILNGVSTEYTYLYDGNGNMSEIRKNGVFRSGIKYDKYGSVIERTNEFNKVNFYLNYQKNRLSSLYYSLKEGTTNYTFSKFYSYESSGMERMNGYSVKHNNTMLYSTQYNYYGESEYLISDRVAHESIINSVETLYEFDYQYNEMGYIDRITDLSGNYIVYNYDLKGQLLSEEQFDINNNRIYRNEYAYDINGNITKRYYFDSVGITPDIDNLYSYSNSTWRDQLTSFKGQTISYDADGNPTSYRGFTFGYEGRQLISASKTGKTMSFNYNDQGSRVSKTVNGITTTYQYEGNKVVYEEQKNSDSIIYSLAYTYDEIGKPVSITHFDGSVYNTYFYITNIMGDVIGLMNKNSTVIESYQYDAYGDLISSINTLIGNKNPLRYRGYYYDSDLSLYYLHSRYYDSEVGRFISADDVGYLDLSSVDGLNLYSYCGNNPVNYLDGSGHSPDSIWKTLLGVAVGVGLAVVIVAAVVASGGTLLVPVLVGAGLGAGLNLAGQGIANLSEGKGFCEDINWGNVALGGLSGAAFATGVGGLWGAFAIGATSNAGMSALEGNSWANIGFSAIAGGASAFAGFKLGKFVSNKLLKINTNLGIGDYINMARVDGAGFLSQNVVGLMSKLYTMGPTIVTGVTRGASKFAGNWIGGWFK